MGLATRTIRISVVVLVAGLLLSLGPAARAGEPSKAEALFEQGLEDMLAEKYETGCPALSDSHYLDPLPGVTFTLAECYAKWGKLASARKYYRQYLDNVAQMSPEEKAQQTERLEITKTQLANLDERIPVLVIRLPAEQRKGVTVRLDGIPFRRFGSEQAVDPGKHTVVLRTDAGESTEEVVELAEGQRRELDLQRPGPAAPPPPPEEPFQADGDAMRVAGWTAGGVGAAGLLIGLITGGVALGEKSTIEDNCVGYACNAAGLDAADSGQTAAAVSTVGFIVGGVGLALGATLLLLAPSDAAGEPADSAEPTVALSVGGMVGPHAGAVFGAKGVW